MKVISYPIRDTMKIAERLKKKGYTMIELNIGDPPQYGFRPFPPIIEGTVEALKDNSIKGYAASQGDRKLREAVAKIEGCKPEDVFVVAGLSEGIDFFFHSFVDFRDRVLLPDPTYPLYISKNEQFDGVAVLYKHDANGQIDVDHLRKVIDHARVMVIINPNNPLGTVYTEKNLAEVVGVCAEHNVPIFYDGSYDRIIFDSRKQVDFRRIAKKAGVPFVYGSSVSKVFMYPGARIGWIAFHGDEWGDIHTEHTVKEAYLRLCNQRLSVNWEFQIGAVQGLLDEKGEYPAYIEGIKSRLARSRDALVSVIDELGLPLSFPAPEGAFYAFMTVDSKKWNGKTDNEFVQAAMEARGKEGVLLTAGSGFSPQAEKVRFRTTFLPEPEQIEEAFRRIGKIL